MGLFNAESFMDEVVEGANSTARLLIPPGVYEAYIKEVKVKTGEKEGKEWALMTVRWIITDPEVLTAVRRDDEASAFQTVMLDLDSSGGLDMGEGRNVPLGKLRRGVGKNEGAFRPRELEGCRALINVVNRARKDEPGEMEDAVTSVAAIG